MNDASLTARCLNCGAAFEQQDISPRRRFAECSHCGTLHNVSSFLAPSQRPRERVQQLPSTVLFGEQAQGATIQWQPSGRRMFTAILALLFVSGGLHLTGMLFLILNPFTMGEMPAVLAIGGGLLFWPLLYFSLIRYLNRIVLQIDHNGITSASRPVPWRPSLSFALNRVRCACALPTTPSRGVPRYRLLLVLTDGSIVDLFPERPARAIGEALLHLLNRAIERLQNKAETVSAGSGPPASDRRHREITSHLSLFHVRERRRPQPSPTQLDCDSCSAPIPLESINRTELAAACSYCGVVKDLRAFLKVGDADQLRDVGRLPAEISIKSSQQELRLTVAPPGRLVTFFDYSILACVFFLPLLGLVVPAAAFALEALPVRWIGVLAVAGGLPFAGLWLISVLWLRNNSPVQITLSRSQIERCTKNQRSPSDYIVPTSQLNCFLALECDASDGQHHYSVLAETFDMEWLVVIDGLSSPSYALIIRDAFQQLLETMREGRST